MTRAVVIALMVAAASPAWAVVTVAKSSSGGAYTGGTLTFQIIVTHVGSETGLVVHDPTPANLTLLRISAGASTLDCTTMTSGPLGPQWPMVSCNVGGEVQAQALDSASNPAPLVLTYRAPATPAMISNTSTVTCSGGCTPAPTSTASATVATPTMSIVKSAPPTVLPGASVRWNVTVTNTGPFTLDSFTVDDAIPAGTTLSDVIVGGVTFAATSLPKTAPDGTTASFANGTLTLAGGKLASMEARSFAIDARVDSGANEGGTISNIARVTPFGGTPVSSPPATTTVQSQMAPLTLQKRVNPTQAKIGDSVTYTLTVTPSGPQPGPLTLTDPIDPALKLGAVKVNGAVVACGATPVPAGDVTLSCGADGRTITVALPAGGTLSAPLSVELAATVLPTAATQVQNNATLTDSAGASQIAPAPLTVSNASTTGASITVTSAKLLAAKDDLVPFVVQAGVPLGAPTLASPVVTLTPSRGLRVADARVTAADGTTMPVKPVEAGASLLVPVGTIPPGATVSILVRARLNGRAAVGGRETMRAALTQDTTTLADASAGVRVEADAEFDLGTILGEVFRDDNGNGQRDRGEPGVGGALVVMDDGLQAVTDAAGRYHLAAVPPGDRAIKIAEYTLPPGSTLTTDVTRIVPVTPGALVKIDFGVRVPAPEAPLARPQVSLVLPELRPGDAGGLIYRLAGIVVPGARVTVAGHAARVDKTGAWSVDVTLRRGQNRFAQVTEWPDGRVVVAARDVYWTERGEGGSLIIPREEATRMVLRFPAGALAEPTFLLEGAVSEPLRALTVAGQALAPDKAGKVAVKLRVPESGAGIGVDVAFADGLKARFDHTLQASGDFVLLVGLAEGKVGYVQKNDAGGNSGGFYAQGRVKLYAKGRIQGRWLLEGGIDIDTSQLESWRDLFRGDPQRIFRNLDPDRFYTVYGDASQATQAAQSRSRLFVRIQLDRSELVFGNLQTGLTGVEMGRYSRAVTGGRIAFVRAAEDPNAPPSTQVIVFGAWLQTARAHDELRGSGGSLYYLSHRDVVEGSEQVRIEVRDVVSDRPLANTAQHATVDYEVDYIAGRVILREPLSSVATAPTLVRSGNVDGDRAFLVVDYEYLVDGDSDDGTLGARATQKLGPVRLGGTVVNEFRAGGNYTLLGGDIQIDLKKWGVILGEYAHSYGALTSFSRSDDGGLSYSDALGTSQANAGVRQGNAYKAEADLHLGPVGLRPYFRGIDQGFTDTAHAQDAGFMQWGADADARFFGVTLRVHYDERRYQQALVYDAAGAPITSVSETRRDIGGEAARTFGIVGVRLGVRSERSDDTDYARAGHRTAVGARVDVRVVPRLTLYAAGQYAVEKGGGDPTTSLIARDNSLGALGAIVSLPWQTKGSGEVSYGAQGVGGLLSLKSELGPGRVLYGTFALSQDRDDRISAAIAAGGRDRIADAHGNARATLYAEDQFRDGPFVGTGTSDGGRAHMQTAGVDLPIGKRFVVGATFERGEVTPSGTPLAGSQPLSRVAGTAYASYAGDALRLQAKGELRQDSLQQPTGGSSDEVQWLAQGMLTWRVHPDLTLRGKVFFSNSTGMGNTSVARSSEATAGFAWRPSWTDRVVALGRYTYLDEGLPNAQAQNGPTDPLTGAPLGFRERAHVMSLAGEGRVLWRFSLGEKVAAKRREELTPDGNSAAWMILWINRVTFHVTRAWDALAEYRLLYGPGPALSHGAAVEVNRIIVGHLRLGVGWNFANFTDDETRLGDGNENGFFVRAQGFY
jgi:fimbrial isopeptide formation D2 family protein/uncharacterized repeat protein (TIGR01451 family)